MIPLRSVSLKQRKTTKCSHTWQALEVPSPWAGPTPGGSITRCRSTTTNIGSEEPWPVFAAVTKSMSEEWAVALRSCFGVWRWIFLKHGKNRLQPGPGVLYWAGAILGREYQIDRFLLDT